MLNFLTHFDRKTLLSLVFLI